MTSGTLEMRRGDGPRAPRQLDVRRERRWRRAALFTLLFGVMLVGVGAVGWLVVIVVTSLLPAVSLADLRVGWALPLTLAAALVVAAAYWVSVQLDARRRLLAAMSAVAPDPADRYHQRLVNIVEELRLASGKRHVEAVVVPTGGMNAFAFSDLRGGGYVGVTEGALSRLSRSQLEGVVAHEFAHIADGSSRTTTIACLLFAVFADDEKVATDNGLEIPGSVAMAASGSAAAAGLGGAALLALLRLAAAVVNGALSRERELEADLAAARYTRDPLSLAQALRAIRLHPVGGGFIPPTLAPLCIRGDAGEGGGWLERRLASHPPLDDRIDALLALANVARRDFEEQARRLEEGRDEQEHRQAPPASSPAVGLRAERAGAAAAPVAGVTGTCPACGVRLTSADYEGLPIRVCGCGGRWVRSRELGRILARREVGFDGRQRELADRVAESGNRLRRAARRGDVTPRRAARICPGCGAPMLRRHFSYQDALEVDYCGLCDAYWFDADELEVLQILAERRLT